MTKYRGGRVEPDLQDDRCHVCGGSAPKAILSHHGARCMACYHDYLDSPIPGRTWPQEGARPTVAELVSRLETRRVEGEQLSMAQVDWLVQARRRVARHEWNDDGRSDKTAA